MNNHPSTKVRRRSNSPKVNGIGYKCGHANNNTKRPRPVAKRGPFITMEDRHGKSHPKLQLFKDIQRGVVRA